MPPPPELADAQRVAALASQVYITYRRQGAAGVLAEERRCWAAGNKTTARTTVAECGTRMFSAVIMDGAIQQSRGMPLTPGLHPQDAKDRYRTETQRLGLSHDAALEMQAHITGQMEAIIAGLMQAGMR